MNTSAIKYSQFTFNTTLKKKNSIIMPILVLIFSLIIGLIFKFLINPKYLDLSTFIYIFAISLMTIIFASIKTLNIFKDMEKEGLELISLSKPISRNNLIFGKLLALIYFGLIWSSILFVSALISLYGIYSIRNLFLNSLLFFIVGFSTYMLISLLTALICYKLSSKISMTIPLVLFIPLSLGGALLSANATTNVNNAAFYINKQYPLHLAGNEANVEPFFINNQKDELLLVPNGMQNKNFSEEQKQYLEEVMKISNNSSKEWQIYSWLSIPYQLLDIFNHKNINVFETISNNKFSNQDKYVYYHHLDNITYKYKLNKDIKQKKYLTNDSKDENDKKYIVPGLLKSHSIIPNIIDTELIYERENAENPETNFPEDESQFAAENNLVGKIKWDYVYEVLKDSEFNIIAKEFIEEMLKTIKEKEISGLFGINQTLFDELSQYINNENTKINQYKNNNLTIFNQEAIKEKKLQSEIERKIYFAIAILNFIYFNYHDEELYEAMIKNPQNDFFGNYQITLKVAGFNYLIGGFSSYESKEIIKNDENITNEEKEKKVIKRYELTKSDSNYLFQTTDQLFGITRDKQIVNKNVYFVIWIILIVILFGSTFVLYKRRDYK
ncbi:ABC transporter permease [Metamycoplasma alkalescens]|uniref:ABC-2 type transport system permease protein n=3 Tax=Metamycoplasma alkalescens TaxID=45363 RepID=A0A318U8V6_9BACT|nr:ABC transporter permease [Metamycoplasma alkalescens]PYF43711.1 ABC-2 type transport system permease protein [Metamycoplasma alkalescens]